VTSRRSDNHVAQHDTLNGNIAPVFTAQHLISSSYDAKIGTQTTYADYLNTTRVVLTQQRGSNRSHYMHCRLAVNTKTLITHSGDGVISGVCDWVCVCMSVCPRSKKENGLSSW